MRRRTIIRAALVGLAVGAMLCAIAWAMSWPRNSGQLGDGAMASQAVLDLASWPLSTATGNAAHQLKQSSSSGARWVRLDYGQVLANWVLIALVLSAAFTLVRRGSSRAHSDMTGHV